MRDSASLQAPHLPAGRASVTLMTRGGTSWSPRSAVSLGATPGVCLTGPPCAAPGPPPPARAPQPLTFLLPPVCLFQGSELEPQRAACPDPSPPTSRAPTSSLYLCRPDSAFLFHCYVIFHCLDGQSVYPRTSRRRAWLLPSFGNHEETFVGFGVDVSVQLLR